MSRTRRYFGTLSLALPAEGGGLVHRFYREYVEGPRGTPTEDLLDVLLDSAREYYETEDFVVMSWTIHPEVM